MPNDAKLGMVAGVGLVIAVAVVFFRKDSPAAPDGPRAVTPAPRMPGVRGGAPAAPARAASPTSRLPGQAARGPGVGSPARESPRPLPAGPGDGPGPSAPRGSAAGP